jgi:cytochrome c oxidase subunit 4
MSEHAHAHATDTHAHHSSSPRVYVLTLAALLVLTVVTVAAAYVNFGPANVVIALAIATMKASLVALFFMHLRHDSPLNAIIFISSLIFLAIFLWFPHMDLHSRDRVVPNGLRAPIQTKAAPQEPAAAQPHSQAPAH